MKSRSLLILLFALAGSILADEYVNSWARSREPNAAASSIEREEVLGLRPLRAGSRTDYPPVIDTTPTRTSFSFDKNFLKWQPFSVAGVDLGDNGSVIFPCQAGNQVYYQYGKTLRASVDGYLFRRIPEAGSLLDESPFLSRSGVDENQNAFSYDHITGAGSFDARSTTAFLELRTPVMDAGFGRKRLRWGNGFNGGLLISGNAPGMNLFYELKKTIGRYAALTSFLGAPDYNPSFFPDLKSDTSVRAQGERYVAGHRAEFILGDRVRIALSELVDLNGQREFNRYLNPLQAYYLVSSGSELQSNLLASGEIWIRLMNGLAFYGEFLNDDITMFEKGNPSRFAYQLGSTWFSLGDKRDIGLRCEYTYVRAYTYTHFANSKNWHIWANQCAGYWLGPDADHVYLHAEKQFGDKGSLRLAGNFIRRGEKNLRHVWNSETDGSGENVPYLQGIVEKTIGMDLSGEIAIGKYLRLFSLLGWQHVSNAGHSTGQTSDFPYAQTLVRVQY
jgi:hypothetical protein